MRLHYVDCVSRNDNVKSFRQIHLNTSI